MPTDLSPTELLSDLEGAPRTWLVTGAAGFIGSHLVEALLRGGQRVVGLDNFSTGHARNLDAAVAGAGGDAAARFRFLRGDCAEPADCAAACSGVDYVLHQAALGSVPRSLENPEATHRSNVDGFLCMLVAARAARVRRFVFASSSSVYGDDPGLPKVEARLGRPLSPYAATKVIDEVYASAFHRAYGLEVLGLRYFNVFGPRQDPAGAYAAVIPRWMDLLSRGEACTIHGDGGTTRDFCYVANAVQANLRAALTTHPEACGAAYNIAVGHRASLLELHALLARRFAALPGAPAALPPVHLPPRAGDIRDSLADISLARQRLGYQPTHDLAAGLDETVARFERP